MGGVDAHYPVTPVIAVSGGSPPIVTHALALAGRRVSVADRPTVPVAGTLRPVEGVIAEDSGLSRFSGRRLARAITRRIVAPTLITAIRPHLFGLAAQPAVLEADLVVLMVYYRL